MTGLDAPVCTRCRRKFNSKFEVHNPPSTPAQAPEPPPVSPAFAPTPTHRPAKRRSSRKEGQVEPVSAQFNGHSAQPSHNGLNGESHYSDGNGHSSSLVGYNEPPPRTRRPSVALETAARGAGTEVESERPFWADDPPPPPKRNFFKPIEPEDEEYPYTMGAVPAVRKSSNPALVAAAFVLLFASAIGYAGYKYVNRPKPVLLSAQPKEMLGNWLSDDGTLSVDLHMAADGTGRITWHVHGYMPPGISTLGDATYHWSQNAQKKIVFHEDTPFDSHVIYPAGIIQNIVEHNNPTWKVDTGNDALTFNWTTPQPTSATFTGSKD